MLGAIAREASTGIERAPDVLRPHFESGLGQVLPMLIGSLMLEAMVFGVVALRRSWNGWTRTLRAIADVAAAYAFALLALVLAGARGALIAAGVPGAVAFALLVTVASIPLVIMGVAGAREAPFRRSSSGSSSRPG